MCPEFFVSFSKDNFYSTNCISICKMIINYDQHNQAVNITEFLAIIQMTKNMNY